MGLRELLARDPDAAKWRSLRAEYDRLEGIEYHSPRWQVEQGEQWRAMPAEQRTPRERMLMGSVPPGVRQLVDIVIDEYARISDLPAYAEIGSRPVVGFVEVEGTVFYGAGAYLRLRIDPALAGAPDGFARILAARAAVAAPHYVRLAIPEGQSTWPSRSAMARLRRLWATTGDYPAPDGWNFVAKTLLSNAYWVAGIDHRTLQLTGERVTEDMARWADAQLHPYSPRYYPSWRGRYLAQDRDEEIFSG